MERWCMECWSHGALIWGVHPFGSLSGRWGGCRVGDLSAPGVSHTWEAPGSAAPRQCKTASVSCQYLQRNFVPERQSNIRQEERSGSASADSYTSAPTRGRVETQMPFLLLRKCVFSATFCKLLRNPTLFRENLKVFLEITKHFLRFLIEIDVFGNIS